MNTVDMDLHCATKPPQHGKVTISLLRLIGQRQLLIGYIGYKKYVACGNIFKLKNTGTCEKKVRKKVEQEAVDKLDATLFEQNLA